MEYTYVDAVTAAIPGTRPTGNNFSNIQIDATPQPVNSYGPILNDRGNTDGVVGVFRLTFDF